MRLNIADVNRLNTCGILHKNKWDYGTEVGSDLPYLLGMKEVLRWHYKRGKPADTESFMTFLGNLNTKLNMPLEDRIALEKAFRSFINSDFYLNMKYVYMNYLTDIKMNKLDVLEHAVPCFQNNPNKPVFIYYSVYAEPKELFLQRYEVMHNAVWSFYNLGKNASYLRIWFDGKDIKRETIKTDDKYVSKAKRNLITIGQNTNMFVLPPIQTCKSCSMIAECDRFLEKLSNKRGKNVANATTN